MSIELSADMRLRVKRVTAIIPLEMLSPLETYGCDSALPGVTVEQVHGDGAREFGTPSGVGAVESIDQLVNLSDGADVLTSSLKT